MAATKNTPLTIYLMANRSMPARGFRDDRGDIRIGAPGGFDVSRPLTEHEVFRIEETEPLVETDARYLEGYADAIRDVAMRIASAIHVANRNSLHAAWNLGTGAQVAAQEVISNLRQAFALVVDTPVGSPLFESILKDAMERVAAVRQQANDDAHDNTPAMKG